MHRALLASLVVAALGFGASAAEAKPVPTDLGLSGIGPLPSGDVVVYGQLGSARPKCLSNRRIAIVVVKDGDQTTWDIARSSGHGAWLGRGPGNKLSGDKVIIKLLSERVATGGKTLKCAGMKEVVN